MKLFLNLTVCLFVLTAFNSQTKSEICIDRHKVVVDAMSVSSALWVLTASGNNAHIETYEAKLNEQLKVLENLEVGYRKNSYPVAFNAFGHEREVDEVCTELKRVMKAIREMVEMAKNQFEIERLPVLMTLISENPGDYYSGVYPNFESDFKFDLRNHPLRKKMEHIQLQDIGFVQLMAKADTALWNIGVHCPNLKILTIFGAEIDDHTLIKMNLNGIQKLRVMDIAENQLTRLPPDFNENNTLEYLKLSKNQLTKLPRNIVSWTKLQFLDLRSNKIGEAERKRIREQLPNTKILFQ